MTDTSTTSTKGLRCPACGYATVHVIIIAEIRAWCGYDFLTHTSLRSEEAEHPQVIHERSRVGCKNPECKGLEMMDAHPDRISDLLSTKDQNAQKALDLVYAEYRYQIMEDEARRNPKLAMRRTKPAGGTSS